MAEKPETKPRKKRGEGVPPPVPPLNIDIDKGLVKIGRSVMKPEEARAYAEKMNKLADVLSKV